MSETFSCLSKSLWNQQMRRRNVCSLCLEVCSFHRMCLFFRAEKETKEKLEKVAEIKKINAQMMAIKSEISKYEDTLKEYLLFKNFLETLTPKVSQSSTLEIMLTNFLSEEKDFGPRVSARRPSPCHNPCIAARPPRLPPLLTSETNR